jgi:hypothetical protein
VVEAAAAAVLDSIGRIPSDGSVNGDDQRLSFEFPFDDANNCDDEPAESMKPNERVGALPASRERRESAEKSPCVACDDACGMTGVSEEAEGGGMSVVALPVASTAKAAKKREKRLESECSTEDKLAPAQQLFLSRSLK